MLQIRKNKKYDKLHTHRVQLHLQVFHPPHPYASAYPLLPTKALGQRQLVFHDLEFSKKHEHIYLDCPSCDFIKRLPTDKEMKDTQ